MQTCNINYENGNKGCDKFLCLSGSDEDMVQGENRYSGYSGEADTR